MLSRYAVLALSMVTISIGLPLENLQKRAKPYSIVNVDGGSTSAPAPARTTIIAEKTRTEIVEITHTAPTVTDIVTATIINPAHPPAPTTSSTSTSTLSTSSSSTPCSTSSSTSTSSSQDLPQPTPPPEHTFVTITVTKNESVVSTRYYDDGKWHTRYPVKTFEYDVLPSTSLFTSIPASESSV